MNIWLIRLSYFALRVLYLTYRVKVIGLENIKDIKKYNANGSYIAITWHENLVMSFMSQLGLNHYYLVSESKDGDLVSYNCLKFGHKVIRGSSNKGAIRSLLQLRKILNSKNSSVGLAIDGPKGPRRETKQGVVELAYRSNSPIAPVVTVADRYWVLKKTWDKTRIPKPFAKILIEYRPIIYIPANIPVGEHKMYVQVVNDSLNNYELELEKKLLVWDSLEKIDWKGHNKKLLMS